MSLRILIDAREKDRKERATRYYRDKGHETKIESLEVGDYTFDDKVVWEYKTVNDFINSINNASVFEEASNQALKYNHHFVIITGDLIKTLTNTYYTVPQLQRRYKNLQHYLKTHIKMYEGAIRRLRSFTNVIEVKTEDKAFNEMLLQSIKCIKSKSYAGTCRQPLKLKSPVDEVLTSVKNISTNKSLKIQEELEINDLKDLWTVNVDNLASVRGISTNTATNIYNYVHQKNEEDDHNE